MASEPEEVSSYATEQAKRLMLEMEMQGYGPEWEGRVQSILEDFIDSDMRAHKDGDRAVIHLQRAEIERLKELVETLGGKA